MYEYILYFVRIEWAAALPLLGTPSLAGRSPFEALLQNSPLRSASQAALRRQENQTQAFGLGFFALCGERPKGFQPSGHLTSASRAGPADDFGVFGFITFGRN